MPHLPDAYVEHIEILRPIGTSAREIHYPAVAANGSNAIFVWINLL
jgi:hypothetical protein